MIHIITGSTLGGAEYVGDHLSDLLQEQGFDTKIHNQPNMSEIPAKGTWLIITSTHGLVSTRIISSPLFKLCRIHHRIPLHYVMPWSRLVIQATILSARQVNMPISCWGILVLNLWPTALPSMYKSTQCLKMPLKLGSNASSIASK